SRRSSALAGFGARFGLRGRRGGGLPRALGILVLAALPESPHGAEPSQPLRPVPCRRPGSGPSSPRSPAAATSRARSTARKRGSGPASLTRSLASAFPCSAIFRPVLKRRSFAVYGI